MNKNHRAAGWKNQIGTTGQIADVQPVTITKPMYQTSNDQFRLGVFAAHQ